MTKPYLTILGERVKTRRLELGLTLQELAERCGYSSRSTISLLENGQRDISTPRLQELAKALEVDVNYFFESVDYTYTQADKEEGKKLIELFLNMSDQNRQSLMKYAEYLGEISNNKKEN